jgi:hypothetical protein
MPYTAQSLGERPSERQQIFPNLRRMHRRRSEIVHGTYDLNKNAIGEFVTAEEFVRRQLVFPTGNSNCRPTSLQGAGPDPAVQGDG